MSCFVYAIGTNDGKSRRTYVGWTYDQGSVEYQNTSEQRIGKHNAGTGAKSTRGRQWSLIYAERYKTRGEAMSREWHLKGDRSFRRALTGI